MESRTASDSAVWSTPQSPVTVEYSLRTLDEIRLAVSDAFFSVPRGGAEIGGILLGKHSGSKVAILDHRPLDCEHAYGPSFALSPRDHVTLSEHLTAIFAEPGGLTPVGWYHSHTRTEILLSDADLEIHQHYFPEPWQVALVLKPHTFQPTRAGFFVREKDGNIYGKASRREFVVEPWGGQLTPAADPEPEVAAAVMTPAQPTIAFPAPEPEPAEEVAESPGVREHYVPQFAQMSEVAPGPSRGWLPIILAILSGLAIGAGAYQSRQVWLTPLMSLMSKGTDAVADAPNPGPPYMGLRSLDTDGQLWIFWDRNAPAVRSATSGTLIIHDAGKSHNVDLDQAHLQAGSFTYGREGEKVDLTLTVVDAKGQKTREVGTYLGKLPPRVTPVEESPARPSPDKVRATKNQKARRARMENADPGK